MSAAGSEPKSSFIPLFQGRIFSVGFQPSLEKHALSQVEGREGKIFRGSRQELCSELLSHHTSRFLKGLIGLVAVNRLAALRKTIRVQSFTRFQAVLRVQALASEILEQPVKSFSVLNGPDVRWRHR